MQEYQQRVVDEKKDLDAKIERLESFTNGEVYKKLNNDEKIRLTDQLNFMKAYSGVLSDRISAFN